MGLSFWATLAIVAGLVAVFMFACCLIPDEKDTSEKAERKKLISKIILIILGIVVVVIIIVSIFGIGGRLVEDYKEDSKYAEYDDMMAGQDWGDGYYYDTNDHAVKKTLW